MDRAGVAKAVPSITTPGVYFGFADASIRLARTCNEYAANLARTYPSRFGIFAALPLPDVKASLAETAYALDVLKADGVGMFSSYPGHIRLGSSELDPLFAELNRRSALVFVHPTSNACCTNMLPNVEDAIIEYQTDTSRAIANYLFNGESARSESGRQRRRRGGPDAEEVLLRYGPVGQRRSDEWAFQIGSRLARAVRHRLSLRCRRARRAEHAVVRFQPAELSGIFASNAAPLLAQGRPER
jgi:hypothetical protein